MTVPLRRCRRNGAAETEWVVLVMVYMVAQKAIQVGRNYFFFGTVFALINVKVMHFIRFVRVKFTQRALIIFVLLPRDGIGSCELLDVVVSGCHLVASSPFSAI